MQRVSLPAGEGTLTGCLEGQPDEFRITGKDATIDLLMGHNQAVGSHVGHVVQWAGNHDRNRDASASDEGTPHGLGFFQVEEILADQGTCKR